MDPPGSRVRPRCAGALDRKFPQAPSEWRWQFVFPAGRLCHDPRYGPPSRFHLHESVIQRAVTEAARRAGLAKRVTGSLGVKSPMDRI